MKLKNILATFPNFDWFIEDMKDTCHCVWGYDLENKAYMAFEHKGNGKYVIIAVETWTKQEIEQRYKYDNKRYRIL